MRTRLRTGAVTGALALVLVLGACTPAQLRMPDGFATQSPAWPVTGHSPRRAGEPVRFGPYSALEMREGGRFSWAMPVGRLDLGHGARHFAFTLVALNQPPVEVQCGVHAVAVGYFQARGRVRSTIELDLTPLEGPMLDCGLHHEEAAQSLPLELAREGVHLRGRLGSPWGEYTVRSLHGYAGTPITAYSPTGFEVLRDGAPVMVVDLVNHGRVHIDERVDEAQRTYFAAAAAALLLLGDDADA